MTPQRRNGGDTPDPAPMAPDREDLVPLSLFLPEAFVDLRYAGTNNFTGRKIYDSNEAFLRFGTVMKLKKAAAILKERGLYLKIWDAYRPVSAQFRLFEVCPDARFVADPAKGFSNHSRGSAVDLTLCDGNGNDLEMPSGFDDFTERASRSFAGRSPAAAANARLLEDTLLSCGFLGYDAEWWHYNDADPYDVVID